MVLLNDGATTFSRGRQESSIDVSFASASIVNRLLWTASEDPLGSDHHPVSIKLDEPPIDLTRRPRWLYREANWPEYQKAVSRICRERTPNDILEYTEAIFTAAAETVPRTSPVPGKKALHWWSPETKAATRARRKALRAAKRLSADHPGKEAALIKYRTLRNACRDTIKKAKSDSWEEFIDGINPSQSATEIWGKVNALSGKRRARGIAIVKDNFTTRNPAEVTNLLAEHFAGLSAISGYSPQFRQANAVSTTSISNFIIPVDSIGLDINQPFRLDELSFALSKAKRGSAGPDKIGYPLIRNLPPAAQVGFLDAINQEWMRETFPESWKHSLLVPIPKPDTPGNEVAHYRPISLTCCASKLMERMVNRRLITFLDEAKLPFYA